VIVEHMDGCIKGGGGGGIRTHEPFGCRFSSRAEGYYWRFVTTPYSKLKHLLSV
jgi:hypothetical protein